MESAKATLRRHLLERREALPDRDARSRRITERILALPEWHRARRLLSYVSVRDEVDTHALLRAAWAAPAVVAVPVVVGRAGTGHLELYRVDRFEALCPGAWGLLEPPAEDRTDAARVPVESLDLLLVPGVGFDRRGGRLGYGGGFFDRLLRSVPAGTPVLALGFEAQVVAEVPMDADDWRVPALVTEDQVYRFA